MTLFNYSTTLPFVFEINFLITSQLTLISINLMKSYELNYGSLS